MSNESAPECLTHKDNRNVQVRLDYVLLYKSEAKAKIVRIVETWTNHKYAEWYKASADRKEQKQKPPEEDLWVTLSYEQLTIFVYGTAQHDTIKQYVDELVASGDIQRRPHPEIPYGPPQYLLNRKKVQDGLDALEIPPNLFDLSPLFLSPRKKRTPLEKYPQGRGINPPRVGVNLPPGRGENTHPSNKHTKKHLELPKKEDTVAASPYVEAAHAFSETENDNHSYRHDHTRKEDDWACNNWRGAHKGKTCVDYQAYIDSGEREETPTEPRTPVVTIGATDGQHNTLHSGLPGPSGSDVSHATDLPVVHQPSTTQPFQVAIASTPDGAVAPPTAAVRQSQDGAATVRSSSEPAPSGKQLPLSLKESEPTVRPETPAQRKRRIEAREKEIWALVEAGLRTKFTKTHRQLKANTTGMERLIEDETNDETIKTALDRLSDFWKNQFDLAMFHAKLPGLVRKQTRRLADKSPQNVLDAQYEAALEKTGQRLDEEVPAWLDFDNYVGNGPEARQRLVEEGMKLVAEGKYTDM